jgi:hypothetical protein
MSYIRFWSHEEILQEVVGALKQFIEIKTERLHSFHVETDEDKNTYSNEKRDLTNLSRLAHDFYDHVQRGENKASDNEELVAIDELIKEIGRENGYSYAGLKRAEAIRAHFEQLKQQKHEALKVYAALADEIRVKMLALEFMLNAATNSATHREKDSKIRIVIESLVSVIEDLVKVDVDDTHSFYRDLNTSGSWRYARAMSDLHHKGSAIKGMEKQIEKLSQQVAIQKQERNELREIFARDQEELSAEDSRRVREILGAPPEREPDEDYSDTSF